MDFHFWSFLTWFPCVRSSCLLQSPFLFLPWCIMGHRVIHGVLAVGGALCCLLACCGLASENLLRVCPSSHHSIIHWPTCVWPASVAPPIVTSCPSSLWPPPPLYWPRTRRIEVPTVTAERVQREKSLHLRFYTSSSSLLIFTCFSPPQKWTSNVFTWHSMHFRDSFFQKVRIVICRCFLRSTEAVILIKSHPLR